MFISKLGPELRERELVGGGGVSLIRRSVKTPVAKNGGKRGEAGGKARKRSKLLCSSFWK